MFFDNHRVRYGQSLSRSFAGLFGGKEKVKYFVLDFLRNTCSGIADTNFSLITFPNCADVDGAPLGLIVPVGLGDGMGGIDDHV